MYIIILQDSEIPNVDFGSEVGHKKINISEVIHLWFVGFPFFCPYFLICYLCIWRILVYGSFGNFLELKHLDLLLWNFHEYVTNLNAGVYWFHEVLKMCSLHVCTFMFLKYYKFFIVVVLVLASWWYFGYYEH